MPLDLKTPRRSVLLSFHFLGTAIVGALVMALVTAFAPTEVQIAVLGAYVSILGGLFRQLPRTRRTSANATAKRFSGSLRSR